MAKAKWTLNEKTAILTVTLDSVNSTIFDLRKLFPQWDSFNSVQKNTIGYGIKQKLADSTAREKDVSLTPQEKIAEMERKWKLLLEGTWTEKVEKGAVISKKKLEKEAEEKLSQKEQEQLRKLMKKMGLE